MLKIITVENGILVMRPMMSNGKVMRALGELLDNTEDPKIDLWDRTRSRREIETGILDIDRLEAE